MLADKDRIFKNLYGLHDWGLKGARARGAWDGTKAILERGRDGIINEMFALPNDGRYKLLPGVLHAYKVSAADLGNFVRPDHHHDGDDDDDQGDDDKE